MNAELVSQAARLEEAVIAAIDSVNSAEKLSNGLVCAVLAHIIERIFWSALVYAGEATQP
jgi:hypothetical protein